MELIEVNGLSHLLDLGEDAASLQRQRDPGRDEFTEALNGGHTELAALWVEDEKSRRVGFQNV